MAPAPLASLMALGLAGLLGAWATAGESGPGTGEPGTSRAGPAWSGPPAEFEVGGRRLQINGYGIRTIALVEVYDCALYLPRRSSDIDYIINPETPSAIRFRIRYSDLPDRPPERMARAVKAELPEATLERYRRVYASLEEGDVMLFSYAPESGTAVWLNGERLIRNAGYGLMESILSEWLAPDTNAKALRRKLLRVASSERESGSRGARARSTRRNVQPWLR